MDRSCGAFGRALGALRTGLALLMTAGLVAACSGSHSEPPTDGGSGAAGAPNVALTVVDAGTGVARNTISSTTQSLAKAIVTDSTGAPVANAVVKFESSGSSAIVFSPAATALTDSAGQASVSVGPASFSTAGAYTLTASTEVSSQAAAGTFNVAIGATQIALGALVPDQSPLSAYGTTVFSVPIQGVPASTPVAVRFTSICAAQNPARATLTSLVTA